MPFLLGIETSCDETSIAILKSDKDLLKNPTVFDLSKLEILANIVSSQIDLHKQYGGVVPELGAREHTKNIWTVFDLALKEATKLENISEEEFFNNLVEISVTSNPGLPSALKVGMEFAKSLHFLLQKKYRVEINLKFVNHLRGHLASSFLEINKNQAIFPHLHLLVSGGNTQLIYLKSWDEWEIIGQTIDDAVGESLDKIGRMVGIPYPGGIWISKIAGLSDFNNLNLPVGMQKHSDFRFSYSGLKTAVRYLVQRQKFANWHFEKKLTQEEIEDLLNTQKLPDYLDFIKQTCISSQSVVIQQLINKTKKVLQSYEINSLGLSGGVSANLLLRQKIGSLTTKPVLIPDRKYTGDNAVMIALAGFLG